MIWLKSLIRIYGDTLDPTSNLPSFVQLSNGEYEQVKFITGRIPAERFEKNETVIGQPDAGDWGGFYVETNVSGVQRYWLIDKMESNLPGYLHDFTAFLNEAIQKLTSPESPFKGGLNSPLQSGAGGMSESGAIIKQPPKSPFAEGDLFYAPFNPPAAKIFDDRDP